MTKIMLVSANPANTDPLRLDVEARTLEERLDSSDLRGKYELKKLSATRIRDFRQKLFDFKPQIVHFTGHGTLDGLVFENDLGEEQIVGIDAVANLFEFFKNDIKCVMLNACDSEIQAKAISRHIPCVIGMSQSVSDRAAIEFTVGFYDALGAGESFERAFEVGRNAIDLEGFDDEFETPVLYLNEQAAEQTENSKTPNAPLEIFISYSHTDEELKDELLLHLSALKKEDLIQAWSDRDIELSDEWKTQIDTHLNTADIILLLVSPNFVASDYCYDIEMKRAMERHEAGEARVIPIILRPTDFSRLPFAKLQAAPKNAKPVIKWDTTDEAFYNVAVSLRRVVAKMRG